MADVMIRGQATTQSPTARAVRRRRPLPSGRAVVGALLVVLASLGTFSAYTRSSAPPVTRYVIATRDLSPGERITPDSLALVPILLPDAQRRRSFDAAEPLHDLTVAEQILEGELLQEGAVVATGAPAGSRSVSFAVPAARAVDGSLAAGELIDVLVTFGADGSSCTHRVAADVLVTRVARGQDAVAATGDVTITVAVETAESELVIAHAAAAGTITVVRTTGATSTGDEESAEVCTPATTAPAANG